MTTAVTTPKTPMQEFQDNLTNSLRDDVARMLPESAIKDMINRVVEEEFFTKRMVPDPTDTSSYNKRMVAKGTVFQDIVMVAAKPIMEKLAREWVDANQQALIDNWKAIVDEGLMTYVENMQKAEANTQIAAMLKPLVDSLNNERSKLGMSFVHLTS
jgi:hypothetical protein